MLRLTNTLEELCPDYAIRFPKVANIFHNTTTITDLHGMYEAWVHNRCPAPKNTKVGQFHKDAAALLEHVLQLLGCEYRYSYFYLNGTSHSDHLARKFEILRGAHAEVKGNLSLDTFEVRVAKKYTQLLESANNRKLPFNLSLSDVRKLLSRKTCFYTGVKFDDKNNTRSIDRIDCNKGYVKGNVVACTLEVNNMKEHFFEHKGFDQEKVSLLFIKYFELVAEGKIKT